MISPAEDDEWLPEDVVPAGRAVPVACIEECAVERICEGERMLYIHPDECVDWRACEPVRAVEAIFCEDDVPDQWPQLTVENAKFFDQLGSPGGVAKTACCPATPSMSPTTSWSSIPWCPGPAVEGRRRER